MLVNFVWHNCESWLFLRKHLDILVGLKNHAMTVYHFIEFINLAWSLDSVVSKYEEKQGFYSVVSLVCRLIFIAGVSWNIRHVLFFRY